MLGKSRGREANEHHFERLQQESATSAKGNWCGWYCPWYCITTVDESGECIMLIQGKDIFKITRKQWHAAGQ